MKVRTTKKSVRECFDDEKARAIRNSYDLAWQEQNEKIKKLLENFITEVLTESKRRKRK